MTENEKNESELSPKTPAGRIKAVIFDLDGTLYSMRFAKLKMTLRLWRSLSLLRCLSSVRRELRGADWTNKQEFDEAYFSTLASRASTSKDHAKRWYYEQFYTQFIQMLAKNSRQRPGLIRHLNNLRDGGVKTAVVSDFSQISERLDALSIPTTLFDELLSSEDLGKLKPHPEPVIFLAQKWRLDVSEVCIVGDRFDLDGRLAENAGMEFVGISDRKAKEDEKIGFRSWPEAIRLLEIRTGLVHVDTISERTGLP